MKRTHTTDTYYCDFCGEDTNDKYITLEINGVPDSDRLFNLKTHACIRCFKSIKTLVSLLSSDSFKLYKRGDADYYIFA